MWCREPREGLYYTDITFGSVVEPAHGAKAMPMLPRGMVAFLFTDIEGSTRLWERDAEAMRQSLARHNAILGEAIAAHGGVHFKTIGDAFQAAFPEVTSAVGAAVAAQRAFAVESWPETGPVRVRMAIHVGEATPLMGERPDYVAPSLNRLARLMSSGHGGQTLLSNVAKGLALQSMPAGVSVRDLGQHRLRDLLEAEHIWQLVIPDLPDAFPPLKTLETQQTNLPMQGDPLLGRDQVLVELAPILVDPATRLLTLTGPGGVGKSRLALHLGAEALDDFADGVFFIDLTPVTAPGGVLATIADVLGVREGGGHSLEEALLAFLSPRRLLLILDNLEQIRPQPDLGRAIAALLADAQKLTILATSRAPLRIRPEREWPLDPLAAPDPHQLLPLPVLAENPAVALFVERARAARPSFALNETNARAIAEIVQRLDGLPLALELAAARLRALSPIELNGRLGNRLDLLFSSTHDRPDRHQTLRAAVQWSFDLLTGEQQELLRRFGVFSGGFTFEAAAGISVEEGESWLDPLDGIEELLAESLIRAEETDTGELRYRMLETIRAFALERLVASGEEERVRAAHLRFFTTWSGETSPGLIGLERVATLARFDREHANLQAALTWASDRGRAADGLLLAIEIWKFWQYRGHLTIGRGWFERLLRATPDEATTARAQACEGAGVLAWNQGDLPVARALLERALAICEEIRDDPARGRCLNNLGNVLNLMGDLEGAADHFRGSLDLARELNDERQEAIILNNLALISMDQGQLEDARQLLQQSLNVKKRLGMRAETAVVLGNLALLAWLRADLTEAISLLEEALDTERELGNPVGLADALGNLAQLLVEAGNMARALPMQRESLTLRHQIGDWLSIPYSLEAIAVAAIASGLAEEGVTLLAACDALRLATHAPLPATDREHHESFLQRGREQLGDKSFADAWRSGERWDRERAVNEAFSLGERISERLYEGLDSTAIPRVSDAPLATAHLA